MNGVTSDVCDQETAQCLCKVPPLSISLSLSPSLSLSSFVCLSVLVSVNVLLQLQF